MKTEIKSEVDDCMYYP